MSKKDSKSQSPERKAHVAFITEVVKKSAQSASEKEVNAKNLIRAELDMTREFSPIGGFPPDFKQWFEVRPTPEFGGKNSKGVFATRKITPGTLLGEYRGDIVYEDYQFEGIEEHYALNVTVDEAYLYTILGHDPARASWVRLVNSASIDDDQNADFEPFLHPRTGEMRVILVAKKHIKKNQQLLAKYSFT